MLAAENVRLLDRGFLMGHNILVRLALLGVFKELLHPDT